MILVRKQKNIVGNALNNIFVMYVVFEKKNVNALQQNNLLNIKRLVYKSFVWSMKKIS